MQLHQSNFMKTLILSVVLLTSVSLYAASGSGNADPRGLKKIAAQQDRKSGIHDGNNILTIIYNYGGIGDWTVGNRLESGIYPKGSGYSYFAEFSPVIGAEVTNIDGNAIHIFSDGMVSSTMMDQAPEGYQYGFEPLPGYANPLSDKIAMSDQPETWPQTWPNKPLDWDGFWNGQYGKYSRADQESYFVMNDYYNDEFRFYPKMKEGWENHSGSVTLSIESQDTSLVLNYPDGGFENDPHIKLQSDGDRVVLHGDTDRYYYISQIIDDKSLRLRIVPNSVMSSYAPFSTDNATDLNFTLVEGDVRGLAFEVETRGYQWANVAAEDILIFTYFITNKSSYNYENVIFGMYGDADVGDDGDQYDDNAWFDTKTDIVYQYDNDFWSNAKGGFRPVYFGYRFLESPGDPVDGIDNDEDGMVDESQQNGIDDDGDWVAYTDQDGNGQWDPGEQMNDDVGTDGLGPTDNGYPGPDADGTEANGVPDLGEPNFEFTDNDESDQIGLTSFNAGPYPGLEIANDEVNWTRMTPGSFENIQQTADLTFLYGSGYFSMAPEQRRKFSIAMVFGEDEDDIFRNADIIQRIYDADYAFAKPPLKPTVTAVPGDKKVTLYWDKRAETSKDHIYGNDFEGYRIYRATDPQFHDNWEVTDAFGNKTFYKPIAEFDLDDGLKGPHPEDYNGVMFDMGKDTGLKYTYTDTSVNNGQTYYYAVTAYDKGYSDGFYERGLYNVDSLPPIPPSESGKAIRTDVTGQVLRTDVNTIVVTPNAPAAGYHPPERSEFDSTNVTGTGSIDIHFIDPMLVKEGNTYNIRFVDTATDSVDNDEDGKIDGNDLDEVLAETRNFSVFNITNPDSEYAIVDESTWLKGQDFNEYAEGLQVTVINDSVRPDPVHSIFTKGDCNYLIDGNLYSSGQGGIPVPYDYKVVLTDSIEGYDLQNKEAKFKMTNAATGDSVGFVYFSGGYEGQLTHNSGILPLVYPADSSGFRGTWKIDLKARLPEPQDIYTDNEGQLWVASKSAGLAKYLESGDNGEWTYYTDLLPTQNIRQVLQSPQGDLLLATNQGVYRFDETARRADSVIASIDTISALMGTNVRSILLDEQNTLWVGTAQGLRAFSTDLYKKSIFGKVQARFQEFSTDSIPLPVDNVNTLFQDSDGQLWVGTPEGYAVVNVTNKSSEIHHAPAMNIAVFEVFNNTLYAGATSGLYEYSGGNFTQSGLLQSTGIRDLFAYNDKLYAATSTGLVAISADQSTEVFTLENGNLTHNSVMKLGETPNHTLWVGNQIGIDKYRDGAWSSFNPEAGDEFIYKTRKNFRSSDHLEFTTVAASIDADSAKKQLDNIAVVPNPYVVTASWEPQHFYTSGRGERKIDFIHLPKKCTIRIFTLRGYLVDTIEHDTEINDGAASWDLTSKDGLDVAYGIYIYHVDAPGIGKHIGKFALIK